MTSFTDLIVAHAGSAIGGLWIGMLFAGIVAAALTEPEFRADVVQALKDAGWPFHAAATQIGMSASRFSLQINGHERMTWLSRAWMLEGFWPAFAAIHARRNGAEVIRGAELLQTVKNLRVLHFRMLRMAMKAERKGQIA